MGGDYCGGPWLIGPNSVSKNGQMFGLCVP